MTSDMPSATKKAPSLALWKSQKLLIVWLVLFVAVIFVAVKTVVHRHESRTAFMKLQKLEKERDKLAAQWSRLKLEQATTLNQVRVEQYARWDLNMRIPKASEVRIIQEPQHPPFLDVGIDVGVNTSSAAPPPQPNNVVIAQTPMQTKP